jgi:phosphoribosylformylglycinamidine cyclo-ligase
MTTYREAGVDLEGAERHVAGIKSAVTATWDARVVGGFGGFAAGIELPTGYRRPVLMMTTDGVGTKLELARLTGRWEGIGFDLVAMCVDDLVATGARPLALVDYLAVGTLNPARDGLIVDSIARACLEVGCSLLGGETAEHPGIMQPDQVDLAAAAVGVLEAGEELGPHRVAPGDVIIGLPSPNLRSNGFSLVRKVFAGTDLTATFPREEASIGEVLLRPSIIYTPAVWAALASGGIHTAAHITGGGIAQNLVRGLPEGCRAVIDSGAWTVPNVFGVIQKWGNIEAAEMYRTFNMGIGFCLMVEKAHVGRVQAMLGSDSRLIGAVEAGQRSVELI